ncbi:hypothetical protein [Desulfoplanes sp.]
MSGRICGGQRLAAWLGMDEPALTALNNALVEMDGFFGFIRQ